MITIKYLSYYFCFHGPIHFMETCYSNNLKTKNFISSAHDRKVNKEKPGISNITLINFPSC